ncbi:MAG: type IV secretion system DNA-binding domain-containing protein [Pseudonocardia sp.]|nr:type IV secretion system DNA-binding domain-containing protein [Pseudonocardia sp.]
MTDVVNRLIRGARERALEHWGKELADRGVRQAWPRLAREAGNPITGLRVATRANRGAVYLGEALDPGTREVARSVLLPSEVSTLTQGAPRSGKTSTVLIPGLQQELAAGHNVVLVTPQAETVDGVFRLGNALAGGNTAIVDFGGAIVAPPAPGRPSPHFTTWDPTRQCTDPGRARDFGRAFAGPDSPFRQDLGDGASYWGQLPEDLFAAAAHLVAVQRKISGLDPAGQSGMNAVLECLGPGRGNLPSGLSSRERELLDGMRERLGQVGTEPQALVSDVRQVAGALSVSAAQELVDRRLAELEVEGQPAAAIDAARDVLGSAVEAAAEAIRSDALKALEESARALEGAHPGRPPTLTDAQRTELSAAGLDPRRVEASLTEAAAYAQDFHPQVRQLAHDAAFLAHQGADVDDTVAGTALREVSDMLVDNDRARGANPLTQLIGSAKRELRPEETRVMSPQPGDREVTPEGVAGASGALTMITYSHTASTGQGPGVLTNQIVDAAFTAGTEGRMGQRIAGGEVRRPVSFYIDEGGALKHIPGVTRAVTDGRQLGVAAKIVVTSADHLKQEMGPERAATLLQSIPVSVNLTPGSAEVAELAPLYGTKEVTQVTTSYTGDRSGLLHSTQDTRAPTEKPNVTVEDLVNLARGHAVVTDRTGQDQRQLLVQLPAPGEPGTPVADATALAQALDLPAAPWAEMRPDVAARFSALGTRQPEFDRPRAGPLPRAASQAEEPPAGAAAVEAVAGAPAVAEPDAGRSVPPAAHPPGAAEPPPAPADPEL